MEQSKKAALNWELMQLIAKHSKASIIDIADVENYRTAFYLLESIVDSLTK